MQFTHGGLLFPPLFTLAGNNLVIHHNTKRERQLFHFHVTHSSNSYGQNHIDLMYLMKLSRSCKI